MRKGPIETPDAFEPGNTDYNPTDCTYDGIDHEEAYKKHKGTGGKIKEVTFVEGGVFGRIPQED